MVWAIFRLVLAVGGACVGSLVVSFVEAGAVARAAEANAAAAAPVSALAPLLLGLLLPVAIGVGVGVGGASIVAEPNAMRSPREWLSLLREGAVLDKLRRAAIAPLSVFVAFGSCVGAAHLGLHTLAVGTPRASGWSLAAASMAWMVALVAVAVALLPLVRRTLAFGADAFPRLLDPVFTGGAALLVVFALFAFGIARGDVGGEGGGWLGIFGVLRRPELDLTPVLEALVIAVGAYLGALAFCRRRVSQAPRTLRSLGVGFAGSLVAVGILVLFCARASAALDADPSLARGIEGAAPLGKTALGVLRRATDRDKDGASSRFGGGDCDDRDPHVNPEALDVPGNGIDEDCSGADTPAPAVDAATVTSAATTPRAPLRAHNVVLLTIDTLRTDVGFLGYRPSPTPNLDALAEKSAVFERAYAMASYTGKSVGPMLIGKYPSETRRDGSHFNTYLASNTLVAERAHDAGFRTFAAHCHWYFRNPTGLNQGMDVWDTSAIPAGMGGDSDTTVSSDRMADVALRLLSVKENVTPDAVADEAKPGAGHFFAWFHFFDPHAQYVPHPEAPVFDDAKASKNLYDGEVWFTDKHIGRVLDFIASQPWAKDTAIVVTADHGEAFSDHGMNWHGRELWESLVRVPLLVYVPGEKPTRVPVKRSHIDLVPTLLELMGLPLPETAGELRGRSLLADMAVTDGRFEERDVFIDMPAGPYNAARRALVTGPTPGTKLIHFGGANYQLYDLAADPAEAHDLAADKATRDAVVARMQALRARLEEIEVKPNP